jgi:carnitine 3-dehydrogenase
VSGCGKRLHLAHEMDSDGTAVAMQEVMFLHVDLATRRSVALPADAASRVAALAPRPGEDMPSWLGRRVGQPR